MTCAGVSGGCDHDRREEGTGKDASLDRHVTPVGRMVTLRARLAAVRVAAASIRPALTRFYDALDQGQKLRFANMN